jgi:hypothetical protein
MDVLFGVVLLPMNLIKGWRCCCSRRLVACIFGRMVMATGECRCGPPGWEEYEVRAGRTRFWGESCMLGEAMDALQLGALKGRAGWAMGVWGI